MGFADALLSRAELIHKWNGPKSLKIAQKQIERMVAMNPANEIGDITPRMIVYTVRKPLAHGEVYYVGSDICELIKKAAYDLPTMIVNDHIFPNDCGYVYFESPIEVSLANIFPYKDREEYENGERISGFLWSIVGNDLVIRVLNPPFDGSHRLYVGSMGFCTFGEPLYFEDKGERVLIVKYLVSLMLFMNQEILVTEPRTIHNKSQRKRVKRSMDDVPEVQTVILRKRRYTQNGNGHGEDREYSCRWIVRGHWRSQWYPSLNTHQPKWIMPYVKGPDDKPLREQRERQYKVIR